MSANLLIALQQVPNHRSRQGQRYPLWLVLLLVVMATLTVTHSYKSLEDFGKRHHCVFKELLRLDISGFPSDKTIRCVLFLPWRGERARGGDRTSDSNGFFGIEEK